MIHGYLDGELDLLQTTEVKQHIDECEACQLNYRNQLTLRSSLQQRSLYFHAPDNLKKRIQLSLQEEVRTQPTPRAFRWGWVMMGASLAALLLIGMVWKVLPLLMYPSSEELLVQEIVADHIRSLQITDHLTDVLSSDLHTVKPWFNGKVDFSPPVKDFAFQDFRLYGGRLEHVNNRAVATLIYTHRSHYINLYIWPAQQEQTTEEVLVRRQGYNLLHWTSSGLRFWAISDLNVVELRNFAHLVQQVN